MASHDHFGNIFVDESRSARNLHALHDAFIASGSYYPVDQFSQTLAKHLRTSPDPDVALNHLVRFTEATMSKASLFNDLLQYPVILEVMIRLFGHSQYFADILVRNPELFRWLTSGDVLSKPRTRASLVAEVERALQMFRRPERALDAVKRLYRREILRIGARDILGEADLLTTTGELSLLSDLLIEASCRIARQQLSDRFPKPPQSPYVIIGLGKLGGSELNYSSDIDVIFAYEHEGDLRDEQGKVVTYHEYFNKFAERAVQNLSQNTAEGHLYRVDTRLRPESGAGPLARSAQSYMLYYESRGELWERQMLLKARPVAGDLTFGKKILHQLEPFVYPRSFFHHPAEEIARIKARIEASLGDEANIKLRAGGIRDIEFIVQTLQLLNGGKHPSIRSANTLTAVERLGEKGFLSPEEMEALTGAYQFLRTLEHRLQTMWNTQTHTVPSDGQTQTKVARMMGLSSADLLQTAITSHVTTVRGIFDSVLSFGPPAGDSGIASLLEGAVQGNAAAQVLKSYGFQDVHQAAKNLTFMLSGSSLTTVRDFDARGRDAFRQVAGDLFPEIAVAPSPDMTFHNLTTLVAAQKFSEQFYAQLKEPHFRKLILSICSRSPRLTKGLAKNPLLLEGLAARPDALPDIDIPSDAVSARIVERKNRAELHIAVRNLLGMSSFDAFTAEVSELADQTVQAVFVRECKKRRLKNVPLALLALGKYGTREISIDADLDLIFVVDPTSRAGQESLERLAAGLVSTLSAYYVEGKLYDVDARLRPEGKNAPLVVDASAYSNYLRSRASLWERQSLTRLRFVCGEHALGDKVLADVEAFVYETPLPQQWTDTIIGMRRKVETRSRTRTWDVLDLKLGAGGMLDVEFLAQMIQLKFGRNHPELRSKGTVGVLRIAAKGWISQEDASLFEGAYRSLREVEKLLRLTLEEKGTVLPEGTKLDLLARCYDGSSGNEMRERLVAMASRVRGRFLALGKELSAMNGGS